MNIQNAIQSSANVIRVTSVQAGDVYKRFDRSYDDKVYFGIVTGVHNDGKTAVIQATEYSVSYGTLDINIKVLRGDKDYVLFPATPKDLTGGLGDIAGRKRKEIGTKQAEIEKLEAEILEVDRLLSGEAIKDTRAMSYTELTQTEYDQKMIEAKSDLF